MTKQHTDFATSMGPWLVTWDELEPYCTKTPKGNSYNLSMKAYLNGELISEGNLNQMHYTFAEILERVSYGCNVYPGDVIGSGTVSSGCFRELNYLNTLSQQQPNNQCMEKWLEPGDRIALEIEALGLLTNTIETSKAEYSLLALKRK